MSPKKNNTDSGVITFHAPFPVSLLKSESDVKDATDCRDGLWQPTARIRSTSKHVSAEKRDEASSYGPQLGAKQEWLSHPSLRRLQAKVEAEKQLVKEMILPLLDAENVFVKELERFLSQQDVRELRRRELLHKRWTERIWLPLQRRVEEHVSSCSPMAVKRRQILYNNYLHRCNTRGLVLLDSYEPERLEEKTTARSCEAGYKHTMRQVEKLPQSDRPLSEPVKSQANKLLQASSHHPATASRVTPVKDETKGRKPSRLDTIPYHISASATPDRRCHQTSCWFCRRGCQQPASSQQLQPSPTFK